METIVTDWAGGRKARVLSRSLTGSALAAPSRTDIDPKILKHVRRTKPQRSSSSSSNPLPYSSDGSLPAHLRFRHSSHESIIHVKPAHSMDGTCSCSELKCKEQDHGNDVLQSNHTQSVEAGMCEWSRVLRSDKNVSSSRNPPFYRVLEFLSCGSIEAATNGHIICSNKIGYLLNLTGVETLRKKNTMACNCGNSQFHYPVERSIDIEKEATPQQILMKFAAVNRFVAEARSKGANVIIFNADGQDSCQAMALQYIMQYHRIPLKNAMNYLNNIEDVVPIKLNENFKEALRLWDKQLEEQRKIERASVWKENRDRPGSVDSVGSFHSQRKIAWI